MTHRQATLLACAICHTIWDRAEDATGRSVVVQVEEYADSYISRARAYRNWKLIDNALLACSDCYTSAALLITQSLLTHFVKAQLEAEHALEAFGLHDVPYYKTLLADITDEADEHIETTNDLFYLARTAYYERTPTYMLDKQRLSILADALEEAGAYASARKLRSTERPYRGLWPIDKVIR